ncbi:MAG: hypothetical protein HOW73_14120 [Polyangiaceae bacterium]|nr:hypothetical protein [Polyangiaceae bacterium]
MCPPHCTDECELLGRHWPAPDATLALVGLASVGVLMITTTVTALVLIGPPHGRGVVRFRSYWPASHPYQILRALWFMAVSVALAPAGWAMTGAWMASPSFGVAWPRPCEVDRTFGHLELSILVAGVLFPWLLHRHVARRAHVAIVEEVQSDDETGYRSAPHRARRFADPDGVRAVAERCYASRLALACAASLALSFVYIMAIGSLPHTFRALAFTAGSLAILLLHMPRRAVAMAPFWRRLRPANA